MDRRANSWLGFAEKLSRSSLLKSRYMSGNPEVFSRFRRLASLVVVAYSDRLKVVSAYLSARKQIRKKWPGVKLRSHWVLADWGESRWLGLTDSFELPISDLLPQIPRKHTVWAEIRAFKEGNPHPEIFSINALGKFDPLYESRREKTPLLLEANPNKFIILVSLRDPYSGSLVPDGGRLVVDGEHRLAIAEIAGLERIKVKAVLPFGRNLGVSLGASKLTWRWFLMPFRHGADN